MKKVKYCSKCHLPVHKGDCHNIKNRTSDYVCSNCGMKYLTEEQKRRDIIVTSHFDNCGLCGEFTSVINIRHYNWLSHPDYWKSRQDIKDHNKKRRQEKTTILKWKK